MGSVQWLQVHETAGRPPRPRPYHGEVTGLSSRRGNNTGNESIRVVYAECEDNTWAIGGSMPASRWSCKHDDALERPKHDAALVEFQMKEGVVEDSDLVMVTS